MWLPRGVGLVSSRALLMACSTVSDVLEEALRRPGKVFG